MLYEIKENTPHFSNIISLVGERRRTIFIVFFSIFNQNNVIIAALSAVHTLCLCRSPDCT